MAPIGGSFQVGLFSPSTQYANYSRAITLSAANSGKVLTKNIQRAVDSLYGYNQVVVTKRGNTPTTITWLLTYSGSKVGGDQMQILTEMSSLTGTNAYLTTSTVVQGSQPSGAVTATYGRNNSVLIDPLAADFTIAGRLTSILHDVKHLSVTAAGPLIDGSVIWNVTYYFLAPHSANLVVDSSKLFGTNVSISSKVLQNGTLPLGGNFNLSVYEPGTHNPPTKHTVTVNANATTADMYAALYQLSPAVFTNCQVVSQTINLLSKTTQWNVTLGYGRNATHFQVGSMAKLTGSGAHIIVNHTGYPNTGLHGYFRLSYGVAGRDALVTSIWPQGAGMNLTAPISVHANGSMVEQALLALPGMVAGGISVSKTHLSPSSQAKWQVTFNSLVYAENGPLMLEVNITGVNNQTVFARPGSSVHTGTKVVQRGASLPFARLTVGSNVTGYGLYWNGSLVGTFHYNTSAADLQKNMSRLVSYVRVETFLLVADPYQQQIGIPGSREWLILLYPISIQNLTVVAPPPLSPPGGPVSGPFPVTIATVTPRYWIFPPGDTGAHLFVPPPVSRWAAGPGDPSDAVTRAHNYNTFVYGHVPADRGYIAPGYDAEQPQLHAPANHVVNPPDLSNQGSVVFTLGDPTPECSVDLKNPAKVVCGLDKTAVEYSQAALFPLNSDSVASAVASLSRVLQVTVSASTLPSGPDPEHGYIIGGTRYFVTFVRTLSYPFFSPVTDTNEATWVNPIYNERYTANFPPTLLPLYYPEPADLPNLRINGTELPTGWFWQTTEIQAGTPPGNGTVVSIDVTLNGQDWSSQSVSFTYVPKSAVRFIYPVHGPQKGGTEVMVYGSGFVPSSSLYCVFGTGKGPLAQVPVAAYFNDSSIMCVSPPIGNDKQAVVSFAVTNTGQDTSSGVAYYTFDDPMSINTIYPPLGPVSGNFTVHITGGPFTNTDELRCQFGSIRVQGIYVNAGEMYCYAPPHPSGRYPLEISQNDQDYTTLRTPFYFYRDPALSRIYPVSGPAVAADTMVAVYGSGFVNSTYLTCRFGATLSYATYVSSNYIICPTPALDGIVKNGTGGSSGGLQWLALSEQFSRWPDPTVSSTRRVSTIVGWNVDGPRTRLFPSAWNYPLYLSRLVMVEISNNQQDFTDSGITYLYQADASVGGVIPSNGFTNEQTPIAIVGTHFVNSTLLRVRIGPYVIIPTFLSTELLLCFAPRIAGITGQPDWDYLRTSWLSSEETAFARTVDTSVPGLPNVVYVEVSNNAQDYTYNRQTFTYDIECPGGYYCPQKNTIPCPRGTFCPGTQNGNFTLCPKGTYNPQVAQVDCFRCPIGFICPEEGMQVPRICPSGSNTHTTHTYTYTQTHTHTHTHHTHIHTHSTHDVVMHCGPTIPIHSINTSS